MKRALLTLCAFASIALVASCGGDDDGEATASPAATVGTVTTSTTLSVEAEVEAAYLRSWDVFAEAALSFETDGLAELYTSPALEVVVQNVERLKRDNTPARFEVDHNYTITVDEKTDLAQVVDTYVNHSVLLDPVTYQPTEADPNESVSETYLMQRVDGAWKVFDISRE